jgi:prepilin-type processing-associated H-X9-DG protein
MKAWFKAATARAFTRTELLIVLAGLAFLAAIFLPAVAKSKARSSRANCAMLMKQITLSFRMWGLDNNDQLPMQVSVTNGGTMELVASGKVYPHFQVMSNELSTPKLLRCPEDTKRGWATNFTSDLTDSKLSYFVNTDATNGDGSSLLCGDRNITNRAPAGRRLVALTQGDTIGWTRDLHQEKGNLGFADGRVDFFSNGKVGAALKMVKGTTNWLAVP